MDIIELSRVLGQHGLICRGGFHPEPSDSLPETVATVLLVGNAGSVLWDRFAADIPEHTRREMCHPLDDWTRRTLTAIAERFGARPLFPFEGPPYWPFQTWAARAEPVFPSPLKMLIHPVFGLWHAYRGALIFPERLDLPERANALNPCLACTSQPCLTACPVDAFSDQGYDVAACQGFLRSKSGRDCMNRGCAARRACPVGRSYRYEPAHAQFHMRAFMTAGPSATISANGHHQ